MKKKEEKKQQISINNYLKFIKREKDDSLGPGVNTQF